MNVLQEEFVEVGLGQGHQTGKGELMLPLVLWATTPRVPTFPCLPTVWPLLCHCQTGISGDQQLE